MLPLECDTGKLLEPGFIMQECAPLHKGVGIFGRYPEFSGVAARKGCRVIVAGQFRRNKPAFRS